jgi:NADH-quinone oxidoreductase subunit J
VANFLFYLMALGAVLGSLGVITGKNPIASVLSLLVTFFCLATIYLLAGFEFLAAAQILVYGGAVMVLFLFVVMLLNLGGGEGGFALDLVRRRATPIAFVTAAALAALTFAGVLGADEVHAAEVLAAAPPATFEDIALLLFGSFLMPFEVVSMLLLAAAIAVIVLAKRERGPATDAAGEGRA